MPLIAVVTPLFPLPQQPYRGRAIYQTVRGLQRYADVRVVCPIPVNPQWVRAWKPKAITRLEPPPSPAGVDASYFSYPVVPLVSRAWNGEVCRRHLLPHLQKLKPDVVLSYWLYPEGYAAVKAAHRLGIPAIAGARGSDLRRIADPITRAWTARTLREVDYVLTVSRDLREIAVGMGASPERSASILNGCDGAIFHPAPREEARQSVGIQPADRVLLYVGRLAEAKGLAELLAAFETLSQELPDLRLVLVGSGPFEPEIRAAAQRMPGRILLPGDLPPSGVANWMVAADLFCLASHSEGCPNVAIEAISCGCPIVATNVGGTPEVVGDACGILVPSRDIPRLTEALRAALSRAWDRDAIHAQFRRTWDDVGAATYEVCRQVLGAQVRCGSSVP